MHLSHVQWVTLNNLDLLAQAITALRQEVRSILEILPGYMPTPTYMLSVYTC